MKFKVTKRGAHGKDNKPIPVGSTVTVKGDKVPGYLLNKGEIVVERVAATGEGGNDSDGTADESVTIGEGGANTASKKP